ncbi:MAG: YfjI family protein [Janthinobacterium lividum]
MWPTECSARLTGWLAVAWLVAVGAVVGNRCGIRPKQRDTAWLEVPNLWGAIVADPSKLKTPTLAAALAPLKQLDKAARDEHRLNAKLHEAAADVLKARKEALKKKLQKAADRGDEPELQRLQAELADLDATPAPTPRRYLVNDTTVEKLGELLNQNPRGLLVFRDELTGLLTSWEKQGREGDRQFYLEAWNGTGDYSTDRIGRGSLFVPNCCISLLGGIQPDKMAHYLRQTLHGENDGMTQRLSLLTWPDPRPFYYVDEAPDTAAQADAAELLRRLDTLDPVALGATLAAGDTIPVFHFDAAGQTEFVAWLTAWQQALDSGEDAPALVQHLAKYRKLYPALALLFHLIAVVSGEADTGPVSLPAAMLAGQWCTYFAAHARRLYAYGLTGSNAATLGEHLRAGRLPVPFTVRDVQQKGWQGLSDRAAVQTALDELSEAGWVREAPALPAAATGRPRATAYEPNPRIFPANV